MTKFKRSNKKTWPHTIKQTKLNGPRLIFQRHKCEGAPGQRSELLIGTPDDPNSISKATRAPGACVHFSSIFSLNDNDGR